MILSQPNAPQIYIMKHRMIVASSKTSRGRKYAMINSSCTSSFLNKPPPKNGSYYFLELELSMNW
jgi:hypothetical protein